MNAEIIAVGTELLLGDITNTDSQFIAKKLAENGINVYYQTVVGDNPERLKSAVTLALSRSDIVITSGGLGPTNDDITKEIVCECMGEKLLLDEDSLSAIKAYFKNMNREMPETNVKQAMLPENGIILKNYNGTAPGGIIEKNGKIAIFLPGPPKELKMMWETGVESFLRPKTDSMLYSKTLRIFGIGESRVDELFADMMKTLENPTIAPYAKDNECILRLTAKCKTPEEGEKIIAPYERRIRAVLGDAVYGVGDCNIIEVAAGGLLKKGLTVSFAESITGGLLSASLTNFPGSASALKESYVTYSSEAKHSILGVDEKLLEAKSAVCREVALQMAKGLKKKSGADICVSVTGVAGPGPDEAGNPQGLVYIGVCTKNNLYANEYHFAGDRNKVRSRVVYEAYSLIYKEVKNS